MDIILEQNALLESFLANLANKNGLGLDQVKFLFCSFIAYPLGFICSLLPNVPFIKHSYCLLLGLAFGWITMGTQLIHSFVTATVAYFLMAVLPSKRAAQVVYVWCMLYLSASHIYRMWDDYMGYALDFTGPQMLLTLKLTTMAVDLYDGTKPAEELKGYAKLMNLKKLPNIFEFYGYVYFFGGFLAGPAFNCREYLEFIDGSLYKDAPNGKMPNPIVPFIKNTLLLVIVIAPGLWVNMNYPLTWARNPIFYTWDLPTRFAYTWFAACFSRFSYYFAWKLSEGSCILAGIGYKKTENGVADWSRATNFKITKVELAQNFRDVTDGWNLRTDAWLKHYIYERVTVAPTMLTFLNSALWHGFYPGYYFSFVTANFMVQTARVIRRNIRPWFLQADGVTPKPTKRIYDVICVFVTSFSLNYTMCPFVILGFEYAVHHWSSLYFVGHILVFLTYIVAGLLVRPPKAPKKKE